MDNENAPNDPINEAIERIGGAMKEQASEEPEVEAQVEEAGSGGEQELQDEAEPEEAVDLEDDEIEEVVIDPSLKVMAAINDVPWDEVVELYKIDPALARAKARGERIGPAEQEPEGQAETAPQAQPKEPAQPQTGELDADAVVSQLVDQLSEHIDREAAEAMGQAIKTSLIDKMLAPTIQQTQAMQQYIEALNQQRALDIVDGFLTSVKDERLYGPGGLANVEKKTPEQKKRIQELAETAEMIMAARSKSGKAITPQEALRKAHQIIASDIQGGGGNEKARATRRKKQMSLRGRSRDTVSERRVNGPADPQLQQVYESIEKWAEERGIEIS